MTDHSPYEGLKADKTITKLLKVMSALRDKKHGCPWDVEQTFRSIAPYTIEEAYEVADAIARQDMIDLRYELGDLLLQVVYHAQIASEAGAFDFHDVVEAINTKMIRRHPHVFGTAEERKEGMVAGAWDRIKAEEKAEIAEQKRAEGALLEETNPSLLDDVAVHLPALSRALDLQKKAAKVGFDWTNIKQVFDKLDEEFGEFRNALESGNESEITDELGDILFVAANLARHAKVDPEDALQRTNEKFIRRFQHIEASLSKAGRSLDDASLEEMEALWQEAKSK